MGAILPLNLLIDDHDGRRMDQEFLTDPERYLREARPHMEKENRGAKPSQAPPAEGIYICPMHPEVRQSAPGKCPKCGMKLKKDQSQ